MTDLAQRIESENPEPLPSLYEDKPLPVQGNLPVTIFVRPVQTPKGVVPGFALAANGVPCTKGIHWSYPRDEPEYSLFITFQFAKRILEVRCDTLWYSVVQPPIQQMCVRTGKATYHFDVDIAVRVDDNSDVLEVITVDPKIIVTPIAE
jgi:hypothetical protein